MSSKATMKTIKDENCGKKCSSPTSDKCVRKAQRFPQPHISWAEAVLQQHAQEDDHYRPYQDRHGSEPCLPPTVHS